MSDFQMPDFLKNKSVDDIHAMMKQILPEDIDVSEGSHEWNFTRPTALVVSMTHQYILPQVIKAVFPSWSYGEYLDQHAKDRALKRRSATAATGEITITGTVGSSIPQGSMFSTASINNSPSVDYLTIEDAKIPEGGSVTVKVVCNKTGIVGNTQANTIIFVSSKLTGITGVTNAKEITGGTEIESDESLIARIEEYDATQGQSFVGNPNDYKRWATSVDGVGNALIITPEDDSGMVTIILTDANGAPANEMLRQAVYNYIMRPDDPGQRLAPVGAKLTVSAPSTMSIGIKATIELKDQYNLESVKEAFLVNLSQYLPIAMEEKEIKYTRISSILSNTDGVNDFKELQIGEKSGGSVTYGAANIPIETTELATITDDDLILTSGTV